MKRTSARRSSSARSGYHVKANLSLKALGEEIFRLVFSDAGASGDEVGNV